jgi:hypothetical protein
LCPFLALFFEGDSNTIRPLLVWERSLPPFPAMPLRLRSDHRSSEAFFTSGFLFSFLWYAAFLAAALGFAA